MTRNRPTRTRLTRTLLRTAVPTAAFAAVVATTGTASADSYAYNAYDTDANGYVDAYGFDDSGDGWEDTWAIDWDENGLTEQVAVDTDGDGWADTFAFDGDEDGYVEEVGVDTTDNGLPDIWGADTDLDGYVDAVAYDFDDDGHADQSEAAVPDSSAYASVSYVFAEADGWTYWEVSVEYGYGLVSEDTADSGIDAPADGALTITGNSSGDDGGDLVADTIRMLF
jgi:hypothetical protein